MAKLQARTRCFSSGEFSGFAGSATAPRSLRAAKWTIKVGTVVLASIAVDDGWWEAGGVAIESGVQLRLRWRDFPGLNTFTKAVSSVTLAPVGGLR